METLPATASLPANYDEISMQQSILFAESLKDLKNLRTQLYSAAEYFELSYNNDDQKHIVVETLKDYAIKALVNTVDHLGLVTYKVNDLLEEKVEEVSGTEVRVSCVEQVELQRVGISHVLSSAFLESGVSSATTSLSFKTRRLKTCREYMDREGLAQQASIIDTPRYHKRYILPVVEKINGTNHANKKYHGCRFEDEDDWHRLRHAVRATMDDTPSSSFGKGRTMSPSFRSSGLPGTFIFSSTTPKKELGKSDRRSVSPHRFPLLRSGSFAIRPTTPKASRPTTPNSAVDRQQRQQSKPGKSASMRVHDEKMIQQYPSKSKRLLKALLSRRRSKKDDMLFTYLDEY